MSGLAASERVRVMIVDDEPPMAEAIRDGLRLEAIAADVAGDGDTALELLAADAYDIAVLDRDISPPTRLAYLSLIDFVPDHESYEHLTVVDITPAGDRTKVAMTVDPMHDDTWTERILAGRNNELDNLRAAIARRT